MTEKSFWQRGLAKTRFLFEKIGVVNSAWSVEDFTACEEALLLADVGVPATEGLIQALKNRVEKNLPIKRALAEDIAQKLALLVTPQGQALPAKPCVVLMVGINGSGKTTTIAKITRHFLNQGESVVLAAGDTFRAAAREQLRHWGQSANVRVIEQDGGDPASVAFSAIQAGLAQGVSRVIVDTAGRLPTQKHLMAELSRLHRICAKAMIGAPHEVWLVLDGTQGQNTLSQIRQFNEAVPLTGLIVSKLDGSAKGGFIVAMAHEIKSSAQSASPFPRVPLRFIGVGERPEDLAEFSVEDFAQALLGGA